MIFVHGMLEDCLCSQGSLLSVADASLRSSCRRAHQDTTTREEADTGTGMPTPVSLISVAVVLRTSAKEVSPHVEANTLFSQDKALTSLLSVRARVSQQGQR